MKKCQKYPKVMFIHFSSHIFSIFSDTCNNYCIYAKAPLPSSQLVLVACLIQLLRMMRMMHEDDATSSEKNMNKDGAFLLFGMKCHKHRTTRQVWECPGVRISRWTRRSAKLLRLGRFAGILSMLEIFSIFPSIGRAPLDALLQLRRSLTWDGGGHSCRSCS